MRITENMDLDQLADLMSDAATRPEAEAMRELLVERFYGQNTADITEAAWQSMLERATNA